MSHVSKKVLGSMMICFLAHSMHALPLGNPADPILYSKGLIFDPYADPCDPVGSWLNSFSFRLGYYGDFVFERHLEWDNRDLKGDIDHSKLFTNAGLLVLNFFDKVDVFTTFGATRAWNETQADFFVDGIRPRVEFEFATSFSWSAGARAAIWECGGITLGIEGQYFSTNLNLLRVTEGAAVTTFPSGIHNRYREWQIGAGVAYRINFLVPYMGVKYSKTHSDFDAVDVFGSIVPDTQSKKHWGFAVGVSLIDCDIAGVTVEGRWGDEKAVHVNGQLRF